MSVDPPFLDRHAAGLALAHALAGLANRHDVVVLGLARGGVAVAAPIAHVLAAPMDTFVCRKLGVPGIEEVAFGALAEGGRRPVLDAVHDFIGLPPAVVATIITRERSELERRVRCYRDGQALIDLTGRTVIVVDDGLASGATLRAAAAAIRRFKPARLIAAVPVASAHGARDVATTVDEVIALITPDRLGTVSDWYQAFEPVDDSSVRTLLGRSHAAASNCAEPARLDVEQVVVIPSGESGPVTAITGDVGCVAEPGTPRGLVIFAHGGGSSRGSYRNRYLAARLRHAGWATLRVDLLGACEHDADGDGAVRFDIERITRRLLATTEWCLDQRLAGSDRIVLFGASTGAAAALGVAAALGPRVAGVVSRAGRIDLAGDHLGKVRSPTLLIVGGADHDTLRLNREHRRRVRGSVRMRVVKGAGHTFEQPGALGSVGDLVSDWLARQHQIERVRHFCAAASRRLIGDWTSVRPPRTF